MSEHNALPLKDRMKIARIVMPELDPQVRARNFKEVNWDCSLKVRSLRRRAASSVLP